MFVDSDDLLLPGAIRTLLEAAQRLDADVVQGGWQYLYTDGTHGPVQRYPAQSTPVPPRGAVRAARDAMGQGVPAGTVCTGALSGLLYLL